MSENWLAQEVEGESKKLSIKRLKVKLTLGLISLFVCIGVGATLANSKPSSIAKSAILGVSTTAAPSASSTPAAGSSATLKASQDQAAYQQALANGDKALAASLLQQAKIDQQSLTQQQQQFNATNNAPASTPSTATAYTPPPTPTPAVCAYPGMVGTSSQKLAQAENQYSNDQQASQTSAMPNGETGYGISASQHAAAWASALQTDQNNINSAQNTLSYYKSQPGC
jgi:hypothetical protein